MKQLFLLFALLIYSNIQSQNFDFSCTDPITIGFTETGGEQEGGYRFKETVSDDLVLLSRSIDFYDIRIVNKDYLNPIFTNIISSQEITEYEDGEWIVPLLDSTYIQYNLTYRTSGGINITASFRGILQMGYGTLVYYDQTIN